MKKNILQYTTKFINSNFRIKVFGFDELGNKINKLVGVSGIIKLIGIEFLNKFLKRAIACMMISASASFAVVLKLHSTLNNQGGQDYGKSHLHLENGKRYRVNSSVYHN